MAGHRLKIAIVGASSLLAKELGEELTESALASAEVLLFDAEAAEGQVTAVGDEPAVIQRLSGSSFGGTDFVFFAGSAEQTRASWQAARQAGATVVDMSSALTGEAEVLTWSPWMGRQKPNGAAGKASFVEKKPDLKTTVIVAAGPMATLMAVLVAKLTNGLQAPRTLAATVLQPASEFGSAGMDELHQQTVSLLSFKDLPQELFDTQVAFNIVGTFGGEAKAKLADAERTMRTEYAALMNGQGPALNLQLLQAPVFHGYTASIFLEFETAVSLAAVRAALDGDKIQFAKDEVDHPSNLSTAGQREFLLSAVPAGPDEESRGFWLYAAADNLKIAATNAIDCALAMRSLRPQGKVQ